MRTTVTILTAAAVLGTPTLGVRAQASDTASVDSKGKGPVLLETSTITATRSARTIREVPASVVVLQPVDKVETAAKSVSDFLRIIPGYTTKDYQSSTVTSPSNAAPSLRGLGGTSASRTLVLLDGIPMNEPFAGWVHWPRIPLGLVKQVEVVRGGGAGVWGDRAMGGVINLITTEPRETAVTVTASAGSYGATHTGVVGTARKDRVGLLFAGDLMGMSGWQNVPATIRGPIDKNVNSRDKVLYAKGVYDVTPLIQVHLTGNYMTDRRHNGSVLKYNNTEVTDLRSGLRWVTAGGSAITTNVYRSHTDFASNSSSDALDRQSETPNLKQFDVPSDALGGQLQWSKTAFGAQELSAGVDASAVKGEVNEDITYSRTTSAFTRRRHVAGHQRLFGLYLSNAVPLGETTRLFGTLRRDSWRNDDASRVIHSLTDGSLVVDSIYAPTTDSHLSYSVGLQQRAGQALSLRGSAYQSFRAPTLNELYKPFTATGNVVTEANASLRPETLTGVDLGADFSPNAQFVARLTAFWNTVRDPVQEVTIAGAGNTAKVIAPCGQIAAGGTCRQRQNLDEFYTHGVEAEVEVHPHRLWSMHGSYAWNPTEITKASTQPQLVGKAARSNSRHQYSASVAYSNPSQVNVSLTTRFVGRRFDDDLNSLQLESFYVTDARVSRQLTSQAKLYVAAENIFNREYLISRASSGFVRVGSPRLFEGGIQYRW
jgi:outer membrane receptor protein involved in Fe transport